MSRREMLQNVLQKLMDKGAGQGFPCITATA
jgi:hypothetical protein